MARGLSVRVNWWPAVNGCELVINAVLGLTGGQQSMAVTESLSTLLSLRVNWWPAVSLSM